MKFSLFDETESQKVIALFESVFSAAEGEAEGLLISGFVSNLIASTRPQDLIGCIAIENEIIVGCIFFSRFTVPGGQVAFILSPVAVSTDFQGKGVGKRLIEYGLNHLRSLNVELAFTYGDPRFYSKTGFQQISEEIVEAPFPLSQPAGWLAQSLTGNKVHAMLGRTQCVKALRDPSLW